MAPLNPSLVEPATRSLQEPPTPILLARQTTVTVTSTSGGSNKGSGSNLDGGSIAGIVIGSIVGVILLIWLFRWAGARQAGEEPPASRRDARGARRDYYYTQEVPRSRSRRRSRSIEVRPVVVTEPTRVYTSDSKYSKGRRSASRR